MKDNIPQPWIYLSSLQNSLQWFNTYKIDHKTNKRDESIMINWLFILVIKESNCKVMDGYNRKTLDIAKFRVFPWQNFFEKVENWNRKSLEAYKTNIDPSERGSTKPREGSKLSSCKPFLRVKMLRKCVIQCLRL